MQFQDCWREETILLYSIYLRSIVTSAKRGCGPTLACLLVFYMLKNGLGYHQSDSVLPILPSEKQ